MSLIANALKAAQQEKEKRAGAGASQEARARSVIGDAQARGISAPRSRKPSRRISPAFVAGLGLLAIGTVMTVLLTTRASRDLGALRERDSVLPAEALAGEEPAVDAGGTMAGGEVAYADEAGEGAFVVEEVGEERDAGEAAGREPAGRNAAAPGSTVRAGAAASTAESAPAFLAGRTRSEPRRLPPSPGGADAPRLIGAPAQTESRSGNFRLSVDLPAEDVSRLLQRAVEAQRLGQAQTAVDLYQRVAAMGAANAEVYNNMGIAYRSLNDLANARDAYRRALELDPRDANAWSNLGVVMDALNEGDQARAAYQEALKLDPSHVGAKVNLARHYHASRLLTDARRLLEQALQTEPLLAEAHYALARVLEELNDVPGALRHYTNFLSTHAGRFPREAATVQRRIEYLSQGRP